jgi:hypothetical protein
MPGLVPGIHVFPIGSAPKKDVDGREKAGHDENLGKLISFGRRAQA